MEKQFLSYVRVSTARQGEHGVSLKEQQEAISRYAQKNRLCILRGFEEQESAAKRGRPVFSEMLKLLRQGQAHGVIIHKIDRGARNLKDWADLGELIDTGVEVHFANESLDLNTRGGRLSADIQAVVAADFIRNLREETKKGFYGRLRQGLYPICAPIGYLNRGGGCPKEPDPVMAPRVREAFELYASGNFSLPRLVEEMYARGLRSRTGSKVSLNGMSTILNNPFYMGVIRIKKVSELFLGIHAPIVDKALFDGVQAILRGKTVPRTRRHHFIFSRMIRCALCGGTLMAELQKGHIYYRCHTRECDTKTIREERVDGALEEAFEPLRLGVEECAYIKLWFTQARKSQEIRRRQEIEGLKLQIAKLRDRLVRTTDAYLDGMLDKSLLEERRNALLMEEAGLKQKVHDLETGNDLVMARLEKFLELIISASNLHKLANLEEKRLLVKKLTSNLTCSPEKPMITLENGAQVVADRAKFLYGSPNRAVPRTWDVILARLLVVFKDG